jgi:hypothetical protein
MAISQGPIQLGISNSFISSRAPKLNVREAAVVLACI